MDLQIIGYGIPAQTRERMDLLLEQGGSKGYFDREAYSFIFDMPTSMGSDPDHPGVCGSIDDCGISVCKASDYEVLLADKNLEKTTVSMVLNASSPGVLGLYLAAARRRGFALDKLGGNVTNYIWDFFGHSGGTDFSPRGSYRLIADIAAYCSKHVLLWNTLTISEHKICAAGVTNMQAVAYASGFEVASPPDRTAGFDMRGVGGITLSDYWANGRKSLHGMLVHNFRNMGLISGLKQAGITWTITFMNRRQTEHFAALVKRSLDDGVNFEVTDQASRIG